MRRAATALFASLALVVLASVEPSPAVAGTTEPVGSIAYGEDSVGILKGLGPDGLVQTMRVADAAALLGGFTPGIVIPGKNLGIRSSYTVRIVTDDPNWAELAAPVAQAAIRLGAANGATYGMGAPTASTADEPADGEIWVSFDPARNNCGVGPAGCAQWTATSTDGVNYDITAAEVWISASLRSDPALLLDVVLHELGHAAGLDHYNDEFEGNLQIMRAVATLPRQGAYQTGDLHGLATMAANGFAGGSIIARPCIATIIDVRVTNQFCAEITWMVDEAITTGYVDGSFKPTAAVQRMSMAAFLYRYAGEPAWTPPETSPFSDVPTSHPFYDEITWLAGTGITTGYADGTFRPTAPVQRMAMAAFLYRFAEEPTWTPPETSPFSDVAAGQTFYDEITWLADTAITTGYSDGTFRPTAPVQRMAMSAFLYRFDQLPA